MYSELLYLNTIMTQFKQGQFPLLQQILYWLRVLDSSQLAYGLATLRLKTYNYSLLTPKPTTALQVLLNNYIADTLLWYGPNDAN